MLTTRRPDLTVIVVCHNGRGLALATLKSARAATGGADVEWIVVDSGSADGTPNAVASDYPDVRLIRAANVGFAAANNLALPHARGRYVLLLNPDTEVLSGTFADLVRALDARPEVGAASVVQQAADGSTLPSVRRFPSVGRQFGEALLASKVPGLSHLSEQETSPERYAVEGPADWLVGAFLAVRREAIEQVGGLDERFFLYSEETEWCYRIRKAGWDVRHLPVMTILHHCGGTSRPDLAAQLSYSKLLFADKHFAPPARAGFRAALASRHLIRLAFLTPASAVRRGLRTRAQGEALALKVALGLAEAPFSASTSQHSGRRT
jgi:N-acetylglucosaminyl-diphospho-decaprenol L-rhamnosyltransferase